MKKIVAILAIVLLAGGWLALRHQSTQNGQIRVKVLEVLASGQQNPFEGGHTYETQTLKLHILTGAEKGEVIEMYNDYVMLKAGDRAFVSKVVLDDGERYTLTEPDRLPLMYFLMIVFIALVVVFGGIQGVRGLLALGGSLVLIGYLLLPGILEGYPILLVTIGVSALIIILGSYVTHGFNKTTTAAVIGMIITITITGIASYLVVDAARLNGISTEEDFYLVRALAGNIDLMGLLLGGMVIGLLGVLYDAAISQAVAVEELHHVAPHLDRKMIFARAIRIGREHIGALVDTIAIAYVGVSLPIILLFMASVDLPFAQIANRQFFATEIIRILMASIGLVLAVPITTAISAWMLMKEKKEPVSVETIEQEKKALQHFHHHHHQ
ncbi:MAG: YibE/F family protein [Candidatus Pacebacteria bacterium]|jgi:uncharacterized membrane protein|nr:YibE/F family protein [Candidatus Paceibacterota bacterium]